MVALGFVMPPISGSGNDVRDLRLSPNLDRRHKKLHCPKRHPSDCAKRQPDTGKAYWTYRLGVHQMMGLIGEGECRTYIGSGTAFHFPSTSLPFSFSQPSSANPTSRQDPPPSPYLTAQPQNMSSVRQKASTIEHIRALSFHCFLI